MPTQTGRGTGVGSTPRLLALHLGASSIEQPAEEPLLGLRAPAGLAKARDSVGSLGVCPVAGGSGGAVGLRRGAVGGVVRVVAVAVAVAVPITVAIPVAIAVAVGVVV